MKNPEIKSRFTYIRGKTKLEGETESDRKAMQIDTILHWVWKIIVALTFLLGAFFHFFYRF